MDKYLYEENRLKMAHRARSFGVASLASAVVLFSIPYIAIGLGFLAILFAVLSKGYKPHVDRDAKFGIGIAIVGICIALSVLGSTFHKLYTDAEYRNNVTAVVDQLYGDTYEEVYGENFTDTMNRLFGEINDAGK